MIHLKNTTYIDWETLTFFPTDIYVNENNILFNPDNNFIDNEIEVIDCSGKYVTKSFGCGHHHSYLAFDKGMPSVIKQPNTYYELLKYKLWKLDKSLNKDMIKAAAYSTAMDCAKSGVTFIIDSHSSPNCVEGSLNIIKQAFDEVGVSHLLSYEISDRDGVDLAKKALFETREYLHNNQGLVGLHSSFTLTNKTLQKASQLAAEFNTGVHMNVAEDLYDQEHCYDIHNMRVVERLQDHGILNLPKSLFIHCLYLTTGERNQLNNSNAFIVQNVDSNLINNESEFNSCHLGQNIMLGLDGVHNNMLRAAKSTYFCGQKADTIDMKETYRRFRQIHHYIKNSGFSGDESNNLVILDYKPATFFNQDNFIDHFIYGIESQHIEHVIANGKLIVKNRQLTNVNEADIKIFTREMSRELWQRMEPAMV